MESLTSFFASANSGVVETLMCIVVATVVLRLELQRRAGNGPSSGSRQSQSYAESAKQLLRSAAPEAMGLLTVLTLAAALRARGSGAAFLSSGSQEAWDHITREWPLLLTADTLLSLQAMLRVVVLLSVVLRAGAARDVPLSDEAAALWLLAGLSRVALLPLTAVYMLDGPVGGRVPAACEVAVVPLLLVLGRGTFRRAPLTSITVAAATCYLGFRNRLNFAQSPMTDGLFTAAHCFDLLASFAYLARTVLIEGKDSDVSEGFTHLLMPVQQALAAYYFLQAFGYHKDLVGDGNPFALLQIGNTAALGAYLASSALYLAERFESCQLEAA